ncbi:TadE family protein [Streptomyces bluensis]|uniref:TadE family protein n=1 Tax=Streptomyces bluensis TaxID=33897 RepID=A0ABW6ULZ3_9ACTN
MIRTLPAPHPEPGVEGAEPLGTGTGRGGGGEDHPPSAKPKHRPRNDRGASILEFAGFLPILLLVGMAAIQLGLIGYGANQAGTAARAAARAASLGEDGVAAGQAAASSWLNPQPLPEGGGDTTTFSVTVTVPSVIPLFDPVDVTRAVTMPTDSDSDSAADGN